MNFVKLWCKLNISQNVCQPWFVHRTLVQAKDCFWTDLEEAKESFFLLQAIQISIHQERTLSTVSRLLIKFVVLFDRTVYQILDLVKPIRSRVCLWKGVWNKALSDFWSNVKFSLCFTREYKAIRKEIWQFIRSHLGLFPGTLSIVGHLFMLI